MAVQMDLPQGYSNNNNGSTPKRAKGPSAELFINIGFYDDDGTFISLPYGLAIDTMQEQVIKGANGDYNNLMRAKNGMRDWTLQKVFAQMAAGEDKVVPFVCIAHKKANTNVSADKQNSHMSALDNLDDLLFPAMAAE